MLAPLAAAALLALASGSDDDFDERYEEPVPHLRLTAWGGVSVTTDRSADARGWFGAEAGWLFPRSTLSLMYEQHRFGVALADRAWTPVALLRWEQRFEAGRRVEAGVTVGFGAGRPSGDWVFWYQLAIGARILREPYFLTGEVGLDRGETVRLGAGVGVSF